MFFKTNFRPANERVRNSMPKIVLLVSRFSFLLWRVRGYYVE